MAFAPPLLLEASVFPGIFGYATGLVGFHSEEIATPGYDFFLLDPGSIIVAILIAADPGFQVFNNGNAMLPNDAMIFGAPIFDFHPVFNIFAGNPGEQFSLHFFLRDLAGHHADSEPFAMTFTPIPAPASGLTVGALGVAALRRRRHA